MKSMSSKAELAKIDDEDLSCGLLLRDIEEISRSLYVHKSPRDAFNSAYDHSRDVAATASISESKSNAIFQDSLQKDKRSSIWNWKPIKALTHTRNHRFNCCFFLRVHSIEGLPPYFNNRKLCVTWKRKGNMLQTHPAQVHLGIAEFKETLLYQCTIYVGRSGAHGSAKYDPMLFLLHASVIGAPTLDIGSRWVDLTKLLPLTLDELDGDKSSSGEWSTSFKLTGRAKGAVLNVSFDFSIFDGSSVEPGYFAKVPDIAKEGRLNHFSDYDISRNSSVPMSLRGPYQRSQSTILKVLDEMLMKQGAELSDSVTVLYQKLDEKKMGDSAEFDLYRKHLESLEPMSDSLHEFDDVDFDVIEQGIEVSAKNLIKSENGSSQRLDSSLIETIDVADIFKGEETDYVEYVEWNSKLDLDNFEYEPATDDPEHIDKSTYINDPAYLDSDYFDPLTSKPSCLDSLLDRSTYSEHQMLLRSESRNRSQRLRRSLSLDDLLLSESIENDFLNMLSIDQDQEDIVSDLMAEEESCSFTPTGNGKVTFSVDLDLSFPIQSAERNHPSLDQSFRDKRNAEILEDLETEALMNQWGLTEKAFQYSPRAASGGFGSPVYLPNEEPLQLPPIVEGKGPIVRTKDGGLLRSMSPLLFRNANNGARLIVQVSAPVVLPSAMGCMPFETLRYWACVGIEKMCLQVNKLMPLEDVTGKLITQVLAEAESGSDATIRCSSSKSELIDSDYVTMEDFVPMAVSKIEGLLLEGLKIQSAVPDQEPPSSIRIHLTGYSTSTRKAPEFSGNFSSERAPTFPILDPDDIIEYSLSFEEWLMLDSGQLHIKEEDHENMSKYVEMVKLMDKSGGASGEIFTVGLKVQLRDPLRNFETVGPPMLAIVQVNRVNSPPQPELVEVEDGGVDSEQNRMNTSKPLFKISEVNVAGFNIGQYVNKSIWGSNRQQQSGSRWLLSSGMAKSHKNLVSNSNILVRSSSGLVRKVKPEDVLWSISVPTEGEAATWDERFQLSVHVRNPDIVFPIEPAY